MLLATYFMCCNINNIRVTPYTKIRSFINLIHYFIIVHLIIVVNSIIKVRFIIVSIILMNHLLMNMIISKNTYYYFSLYFSLYLIRLILSVYYFYVLKFKYPPVNAFYFIKFIEFIFICKKCCPEDSLLCLRFAS